MNIEALNSTVIRVGHCTIRVGSINMVAAVDRICEIYITGLSRPISLLDDEARAFLDEYRSATMSPREYLESRRER